MKFKITKEQFDVLLKEIINNQEVVEQSEVPSAEPTSGVSSQQSGGEGYPTVGKWESGVTRGPSNQVGITKWSDVVGSSLKRGKANQLK
jgi:hypothetical protein